MKAFDEIHQPSLKKLSGIGGNFFILIKNISEKPIANVLASERQRFPLKIRKNVRIPTPTISGNGTPLQYSCLENPMDRGSWQAAVQGVAKSGTRLSDFTFIFTFHFHALEKEMATHSSVLAWRIPGTGEPGGLPSMGSHRVGHD